MPSVLSVRPRARLSLPLRQRRALFIPRGACTWHATITNNRGWLLVICLLVLVRVVGSSLQPIMEFSEARYAEISRIIFAGGDWITLWFYQDQPFWGKPPLAFWSVATSFHLFGLNEFAARLPSLLFTALTAWMIAWWCRNLFDRNTGRYAVLIFCSCWLVLHTSGAVITDPLLTFCTTLAMIAFWQSICLGQKLWGYLLLARVGVGSAGEGTPGTGTVRYGLRPVGLISSTLAGSSR